MNKRGQTGSRQGNVIRPKGGVAREEQCVVLCARQDGGVSAEDGFAVRVAEGPVLGVFTDSRILETLPIGEVVSQAMKKAMHAS